ncbi:hypothetical protein [Caulobacter sp. UNC279MFTsu5.1]|uniref:hypothetical protein n=1 Tax=Caulobacter sp. UNC279MFTsu5.1 TaxID=1502775 RepID=UPI0003620CD9|nr:hypothetical protein [Caulobacter sp. UNC279MFTsu5.1]SFI86125.1 hypothetical protein SAMN02799626_00718 [Caulobacter sp. UNC279MFTsu5.1]
MGSKLFILACAAGLAVVSAASAQPSRYVVTVKPVAPAAGYQKLSIAKAVVGSNPIRVWANTAIDPDCSVHEPGASLTILEPPAHGTAVIKDDPYFAAFPPGNPRAACNSRKVPGHQAFYTAASGYAGHDRMVLQGSSPDGAVRRIAVDITVR